ncbi:MAG TPA: hypothetical protein VM681_08390 [Candidatus Thermoplasmatota archaeon]|nr:hypothetical protein [Candidatus Thermoplasmatota archaeon]
MRKRAIAAGIVVVLALGVLALSGAASAWQTAPCKHYWAGKCQDGTTYSYNCKRYWYKNSEGEWRSSTYCQQWSSR